MDIQKVQLVEGEKLSELTSEKSSPSPEIGSMLSINLNGTKPAESKLNIRVTYKTNKDAKAFRWLPAE